MKSSFELVGSLPWLFLALLFRSLGLLGLLELLFLYHLVLIQRPRVRWFVLFVDLLHIHIVSFVKLSEKLVVVEVLKVIGYERESANNEVDIG